MVRVGIVSSVDASKHMARVYYPDAGNMVSGWLYVLKTSSSWMPTIDQRVLVIYPDGWNEDGYIDGVIS